MLVSVQIHRSRNLQYYRVLLETDLERFCMSVPIINKGKLRKRNVTATILNFTLKGLLRTLPYHTIVSLKEVRSTKRQRPPNQFFSKPLLAIQLDTLDVLCYINHMIKDKANYRPCLKNNFHSRRETAFAVYFITGELSMSVLRSCIVLCLLSHAGITTTKRSCRHGKNY